MRALAVWGDKRLASMPDVPSMKELGYDATFYIWSGLFAPAATPPPIMTVLRDTVRRTVEDAEFKDAMAKVETPIAYLDAPEFKTFLDRDAKRLRVAVERIGKVPETNYSPCLQGIFDGQTRSFRAFFFHSGGHVGCRGDRGEKGSHDPAE